MSYGNVHRHRLAGLAVLLLGAGCHVDVNAPGTAPPAAQFYFPAALVIDPSPSEPFLYVANYNSDLRFSGGTVQVIDLARFHCAVDEFRSRGQDPARFGCAQA